MANLLLVKHSSVVKKILCSLNSDELILSLIQKLLGTSWPVTLQTLPDYSQQ